jgi:trans-aconitate 2-methyltransferase
MPWDPAQYQKFQAQRAAPFDDLLALIAKRENLRVIDLGCGTGELTRRLADALPNSEVIGIDSSAEMLERANKHERPRLNFSIATIEKIDGRWDLIFSNAALHWVPDHRALFARLMAMVNAGGQLIVQMPSNWDHPSQTILREMGHAELGWGFDFPTLPLNAYGDILWRAGGTSLTIMEKLYCHEMPSSDEIAEWMRGTAMVPYLERLAVEKREPFWQRYRERLRAEWPQGPVFFGFRRILIGATKEK